MGMAGGAGYLDLGGILGVIRRFGVRRQITTWVMVLVALAPMSAWAQNDEIPKKAECTTCAVRGATHGEEDVAAWREYEDARYYFCSTDCAEAFDGFPTAYITHPVPRPAPAARLNLLSGETLDLASLKGSVVLVDFWATWCQPCRKAMPMLNEMHEASDETGLKVIGIAIDEEPTNVVPKFVEKQKLAYPIALDGGERPAWYNYNVAAIPAMFLIDAEGQIVGEWRGEFKSDDVRNAVRAQLAKQRQ